MDRQREAEILRIWYQYQEHILKKRGGKNPDLIRKIVGPDRAYHSYSQLKTEKS